MEQHFKAVSINYKSTPLSIREKLSLSDTTIRGLLLKLQEYLGLNEAMIISTCNRTEVYYYSPQDLSESIIKLVCAEKACESKGIAPYFEKFGNSIQAITHLFRVSMGLESQVVGDIQISNQVKRAYQASADTNMAGPFLHRLMHTIFFTNKRVVQETPFRDGAASVSYAAVEMIEELAQRLQNPRILVVGLGEIGTDVVKNLADSTKTNVYITNRTFEKASQLAKECDFEAIPFEHIWEETEKADVVISSIAMDTPFFTKEKLGNQLSFKCFIDLAVPQSVDKSIEELSWALVYHIDDINNRTSQALGNRLKAIPQVEAIVQESIVEFSNWSQEMAFSPTIQKFKEALEGIRQEELQRYLKKLDKGEYERVDKITKSILNKIIRMPVLQLKAACRRGEAETLTEVLQELFDLEKTEKQSQANA